MNEEKQKRGFALLSPEKRREMSKKGGVAARDQGKIPAPDRERSIRAGRLGGAKIAAERGSRYYAEIGRLGGIEVQRQRRARAREKEAAPCP